MRGKAELSCRREQAVITSWRKFFRQIGCDREGKGQAWRGRGSLRALGGKDEGDVRLQGGIVRASLGAFLPEGVSVN